MLMFASRHTHTVYRTKKTKHKFLALCGCKFLPGVQHLISDTSLSSVLSTWLSEDLREPSWGGIRMAESSVGAESTRRVARGADGAQHEQRKGTTLENKKHSWFSHPMPAAALNNCQTALSSRDLICGVHWIRCHSPCEAFQVILKYCFYSMHPLLAQIPMYILWCTRFTPGALSAFWISYKV